MHPGFYAIFCSILVFFYVGPAQGQQFGGNSQSVKWNQVNSDTARVIFPQGLEEAGQRVSSIIHELQANHLGTIGHKLRKINIVLQNQSTESNGYVSLGPYRSEFFLFPPQNNFQLGTLQWHDLLSLHEYRHIAQYSNFNVGLSKAASILFGQQGQALANAASVPDWFFEGDAVFNETVLTRQGRGRLPYFFKGYVSLYNQDRRFSYMKLRNGSYVDYVPDHYQLGYLLVAYGREKYGADFWRKVSHNAAAFKPLLYPWQGAVKKFTGLSYKRFVADAFTFYNKVWIQSKEKPVNYITPASSFVTDYKYPYVTTAGDIIVLKRSYRRIPAFYKISPGKKEAKIGIRDISNDDYFSYNNGHIAYSSFTPDRRWGYREFSDIKLMNVQTGKTRKITHRQKFFSPDVSHDGKKVVAVEMGTNQTSALVATSVEGEILFRSKAAKDVVYTYPKFSSDDQFIYSAVKNEKGKMALVKIDMETGSETNLIPFSERIFGFPTIQGDTVIFTNTFKGSDETWAFVESTGVISRLAVHPSGFYQAAYDVVGKRLVASNFTADGYRLAAIPAGELLWTRVEPNENPLPDLFVRHALQQEKPGTLQIIPNRNFSVKKYKKAFNVINFHSWRPEYSEPRFTVTLLGENVLNTMQTELFYSYNKNENSHGVGGNAIYGGWYIQPLAGINNTWSRSVLLNRTPSSGRDTAVLYDELNANAGLKLPLNFSSGKQYRYLTLTSTINRQQVTGKGNYKNFIRNQGFNYWQGRLEYTGQVQKAIQQIYPRWAHSLLIQYRATVNRITAKQLLTYGSIYLPGLHVNHNFILTAGYQQRDTLREYTFSNNFPFARGYAAVDFPRMYRLGSNYHFPLFYPDWGVANIVYFRRLRANVFYDYSRVKSLRTSNTVSFNSSGAELFFDTRWWNQQNVSFGVRYTRLLDYKFLGLTQPNRWELILPVGLY